LSAIKNIGYAVDDNLVSMLIPSVYRCYYYLKIISRESVGNDLDNLNNWISWTVKTLKNTSSFYSNQTYVNMVDSNHLEELLALTNIELEFSAEKFVSLLPEVKLLSIRFSSQSPEKQETIQHSSGISIREEIDSLTALNNKLFTINYVIPISIHFPSDMTTQFSDKHSYTIFSTSISQSKDRLMSNILSLSILNTETVEALSVDQLTSPIDITFYSLVGNSTNATCKYFNESSQLWSSNGVSTWIEQALKTSQGLLLTVKCSTNHLTIFGVFDETVISPVTPLKSIYPITSNSSIAPRVQDNTATIIIAATVVPVVSIIIIIVVIVISVLLLILFLRRRKQKNSVKKEPEIELEFEDVRHE